MSQSTNQRQRILEHFSTCEDPRTRPVRYPFLEIIITTVLAIVCGEEGWEGFADWGQDKLTFLRQLQPLKMGYHLLTLFEEFSNALILNRL